MNPCLKGETIKSQLLSSQIRELFKKSEQIIFKISIGFEIGILLILMASPYVLNFLLPVTSTTNIWFPSTLAGLIFVLVLIIIYTFALESYFWASFIIVLCEHAYLILHSLYGGLGRDSIFFGASILLFATIIVFASLRSIWYFPLISSVIGSITFSSLYWYRIFDAGILRFKNTPVEDFIQYTMPPRYILVFLILGMILSFGKYFLNSAIKESIALSLRFIISGAHNELMLKNGVHVFQYYTIMLHTFNSSEIIGADFTAAEETEEGVFFIIGDITGHGLNVSPGAFASLSVFSSEIKGFKNPKNSIERIHKVLSKISSEHGGEGLVMVLFLGNNGTVIRNGTVGTKMHVVKGDSLHSFELENSGYVLGKDSTEILCNSSMQLDPKDILILLTDGAENTDAMDDQTRVIITYNPQ